MLHFICCFAECLNVEYRYAECHCAECRVLFDNMLNVIMRSFVMLSVTMPSVVMLSVIMPSVIILSVIMLSVAFYLLLCRMS